MNDVQDANARFNAMWDEIGAKKIVIGDEEDGIEIVVDADLSFFNVIDKLKAAAQDDADKGDPELEKLNRDEKSTLEKAAAEAGNLLENAMPASVLERLHHRRRRH